MLFKDRLSQCREAAGMTQSQLAEMSGVTLAVVRKYEQGVSGERLNFGYIARLARALGQTCQVFAECDDVIGDDEAESLTAEKPKRGRPPKK